MQTVSWFLGVGFNLALIAWVIYATRTVKRYGAAGRKTVQGHLPFIAGFFVIFFLVDPLWFSKTVYQGMWLHAFESVVVAIALMPVWYAWGLAREKKRRATASSFVLLALGVAYAGHFVVQALSMWQTAEAYRFESRRDLVVTEPGSVRYTPLFVGWNEMVQRLNESAFTVTSHETDAVEWNDRLVYVAPLTPDGLVNSLVERADGLMVYDDSSLVADDQRVKRIRLPWKYGEGMQIWDNLYRVLSRRDPWAQYGDAYYSLLPDGEMVAVVPKLKYAWRFLWRYPLWAGTEIVHANGNIESLSKEAALRDPRLAAVRLFPEELARMSVHAQTFDQGPLSGLYNRRGKIKVPVLPMQNQMPYLIYGADRQQYWITATEPAGQSYALFRMYYTNARTGARSMFEWDPDKGVLGPERGIQRVKSIPGYRWVGGAQGEGDFHVLEAVPITRAQDPTRLWWKYTITTEALTGVVKTVVVDSSGANEELLQFDSRAQFSAWLSGKRVEDEPKDSWKTKLQELLQQNEAGRTLLEELLRRDEVTSSK